MAFSMQICLFRCLSEGVGCRQYVLNFKHFWIWSEGGVGSFQKVLKFKKFWIIRGGGGPSLIGNFSQIFPFFFSDGSPKKRTSGSKRCARSPIQSVRDEPNQFNMQRTTQSMIRGLFEFQDCPLSTVHSKSRMGGVLRNRGQGFELYETILDFTGQYCTLLNYTGLHRLYWSILDYTWFYCSIL